MPEDVVSVVTTRRAGAAVVSAMLHDPRVRALSFTGSTEVGRRLLHEDADQVGAQVFDGARRNAPLLVVDDADLDAALMMAKMRNGGQACTAANRIYVPRGTVGPGTAEGHRLRPAHQR